MNFLPRIKRLFVKRRIKEYLYFHLPGEEKKALFEYLKDRHHFEPKSKNVVDNGKGLQVLRIVPLITLQGYMTKPEYKFTEGEN